MQTAVLTAMLFPLRGIARSVIYALRASNSIKLSARLTIQEITVSRQGLILLITYNSRFGIAATRYHSRVLYKTLQASGFDYSQLR